MAVNTLGRIVDEPLVANNMPKYESHWLGQHEAKSRINIAPDHTVGLNRHNVAGT